MSTSLIGDGILLVALAWQVYALSGAPAAMSVVGFALSLPQVATLLFGGVKQSSGGGPRLASSYCWCRG